MSVRNIVLQCLILLSVTVKLWLVWLSLKVICKVFSNHGRYGRLMDLMISGECWSGCNANITCLYMYPMLVSKLKFMFPLQFLVTVACVYVIEWAVTVTKKEAYVTFVLYFYILSLLFQLFILSIVSFLLALYFINSHTVIVSSAAW